MGERLVFWRDDTGRVSCLSDTCAHRGAALSKGKLEGHSIRCPFHGIQYDAGGKCVLIPANGRSAKIPEGYAVTSYPAFEKRGFIWIWWGNGTPDPAEPYFFPDIPEGMPYASARDPWKTHYSRGIENQLDVVHLPFVHYNTIGRGNRTLVDGPGFEWRDDSLFYVYVYNRVDDGTRPKTPSEVPIPNPDGFKLEFHMPNLWQNHIADAVRIVAAFVPVDEGNFILYLRFYQSFIKIPGLRRLVCALAMPYNLRIAHQDRRVVETQLPKASLPAMGERLIQGDLPIMEYRKRRFELLKAASKKG